MDALSQLTKFLEKLSGGAIAEASQCKEVERLLSSCWDEFQGHQVGGMVAYKLHDRTESLEWHPPNQLSFSIERHGGVVLGSTKATKQTWVVDLKERTARMTESAGRVVGKSAKPLDIEPIAQRLAQSIERHATDDYLTWFEDPSCGVRVALRAAVRGDGAAANQTIQGRRNRLLKRLRTLLEPIGWRYQAVGSNTYFRPPKETKSE